MGYDAVTWNRLPQDMCIIVSGSVSRTMVRCHDSIVFVVPPPKKKNLRFSPQSGFVLASCLSVSEAYKSAFYPKIIAYMLFISQNVFIFQIQCNLYLEDVSDWKCLPSVKEPIFLSSKRIPAPISVAARSRAWVRILFKAWTFVLIIRCCIVLCRWRPRATGRHPPSPHPAKESRQMSKNKVSKPEQERRRRFSKKWRAAGWKQTIPV